MITLLIAMQVYLGTIMSRPDPGLIEALQKRGLSTLVADFPKAMDKAFATRDKELLLAMAKDMRFSERGSALADQAIRLYEALPEDDFKESISVPLALGLQFVERVMQSRCACEFYEPTLKLLYSQTPTKGRGKAVAFLQALAVRCGLELGPYVVRAVLLFHDDEIDLGTVQQSCWPFVTSAMAYHILRCYPPQPGITQNENIFGPFRERAKPLLDAKEFPPGSSLKDVLKQLEAMIAADGKKLCDKYGKMEYKPAPPSAPRAPNDLLE
jgi:hypothetical protein